MRANREEFVKHPPDKAASHKYDVKKVHKKPARYIYGFKPIPAGGAPVTNEIVNKLRNQLGI